MHNMHEEKNKLNTNKDNAQYAQRTDPNQGNFILTSTCLLHNIDSSSKRMSSNLFVFPCHWILHGRIQVPRDLARLKAKIFQAV
jgi:hypothetical protein